MKTHQNEYYRAIRKLARAEYNCNSLACSATKFRKKNRRINKWGRVHTKWYNKYYKIQVENGWNMY